MNQRNHHWVLAASEFVNAQFEYTASGGASSVPGGPVTLYGTCYALLARYYLGIDESLSPPVRDFIARCQDTETGLMIGPELRDYKHAPGVIFDREHLLSHLTC